MERNFVLLADPFFVFIALKVVMIEPDHGFLKPQQTVLLKVGEIPSICILLCCLLFLENARCNITILQKKIDVSLFIL